MDDFHDRVRQRAYRLWMEEGCPEGRSDAHWDKARELVAIEENHKATLKPAPDPEQPAREPVEPLVAVENAGEFPTLTDQGEEQAFPKPRAAAAKAKSPLRAEAAKPATARTKAESRGKSETSKPETSAKAKPARPKR